MEASEISPNYRYWQDNGAYWVEEYLHRKRTQVYFDIQELMLAEYLGRCAPARVLEFGCGVGRHLKYLRNISGIEIYGYDQSPTMLEGVRQWAGEEWFNKHITLGAPVSSLPYPDKFFDIAFTSEVLIHVCPSDLPAILKELIRVSKRQVFHYEPAPDFEVAPDAHNGCWNHNLIQAYADLGFFCEMLPQGFRFQAPYRVLLDKSFVIPESTLAFTKLLELEADIQPTLNRARELEENLNFVKSTMNEREKWINELENYRDELQIQVFDLTQRNTELELALSSRLYRLVNFIASSRYIRPIKSVMIWTLKRRNSPSVIKGNKETITEDPDQLAMDAIGDHTASPIQKSLAIGNKPKRDYTAKELAWLERFSRSPKALSVLHPEWMGIRNAASQLFDEIFTIPDTLDEASARHYIRLFIESGCPGIVIHGFPLSYKYLVNAAHELAPKLPIYNIWHGGFVQANEYADWRGFSLVNRFCQNGLITKWGFVKKGMAEVVAKNNIQTSFIMNMVRAIPESATSTNSGIPNIGIWGSWRKWPYAMMASAKLLDNSKLFVWGGNERTVEFDRLFRLNSKIQFEQISHAEVMNQLAKMDINLYVSLYECAPMLPLESLSVGVPCILGPHSHYFEDDPYLYERLIVRSPDRADVIAENIRTVLKERNQIIDAYKPYAIRYNQQAKLLLSNFLELEDNQIWE